MIASAPTLFRSGSVRLPLPVSRFRVTLKMLLADRPKLLPLPLFPHFSLRRKVMVLTLLPLLWMQPPPGVRKCSPKQISQIVRFRKSWKSLLPSYRKLWPNRTPLLG